MGLQLAIVVGVLLHVGRSTVIEDTILVDVQAASDGVASFPHLTIVLAENAEASVVVNYRSEDGLTHVAVPQVEAIVGDLEQMKAIRQTYAAARSAGSRRPRRICH